MKYIIQLFILVSLLFGEIVMADEISLREKIGQMLIMGFEGKEVNDHSAIVQSIQNENIGGVILFDYNYQTQQFDKNIESPAQVTQLNTRLQQYAQIGNQTHHRPLLPLLISVDYEGGRVDRLKAQYGFPETVSAATVGTMNESQANTVAQQMALTLKAAGFNLNFAPVVDVNVNPDNPIMGKLDRSFSNDPSIVSFYAQLYAENFLSHGVQCAYKHFPGHGSSTTDSHLGFVDVTDSWQSYELQPYSSLSSATSACGMIMTAHVVNRQLDETGLPATLSYEMLTKVLREQLQFDGVIITDDMQMKAITDHYGLERSVRLAINAGADMLIFGNQLSEQPQSATFLVDMIETGVQSGLIRQERIDEAYRRIVALKQSYETT